MWVKEIITITQFYKTLVNKYLLEVIILINGA